MWTTKKERMVDFAKRVLAAKKVGELPLFRGVKMKHFDRDELLKIISVMQDHHEREIRMYESDREMQKVFRKAWYKYARD